MEGTYDSTVMALLESRKCDNDTRYKGKILEMNEARTGKRPLHSRRDARQTTNLLLQFASFTRPQYFVKFVVLFLQDASPLE